MSQLQNQINNFKSSVIAASNKVANKRSALNGADPSPSPTPNQSTSQNDLKRKRPETTAFSQPANTGTGKDIKTQIYYAIENMKEKGRPQTLTDIISYLNIHNESEKHKANIAHVLKNHAKVIYDPKNDGGEGTFSYRPIHNIRTADGLLGFLQSQKDAKGLDLKTLKDGWSKAEDEIGRLEKQDKLLVTRNKKDNHVKMVWLNDPTLNFPVDDEDLSLWHKIKLPEPEQLANELERAGLHPANKNRGIKVKTVEQVKKTKKPRKGGKTTNTHMAGVLRDYSHLKK
ncbi:hypothetical protein ACLMJK_005405 [Lecanora helva]